MSVNSSELALNGGPKAVTLDSTEANKWPIITKEDEEAVLDVLRSGELSIHPVTNALEEDYKNYFGRKFALAHCNGTSALLAAFFAAQFQPGDEVLVPSATWWASAVPALWVGAIPVFCESEPERCGLDPNDVLKKITPKTKAMVVVHLWGMPSKMTELLQIAKDHNLLVIEDASHAHGAVWRNKKCGAIGDMSIFSLQSHKLAPAGEGGIFMTDREDLFEKAILLGDVNRIYALNTASRRFAGTSFGIKTRMAPLSAAVGRSQLKRLEERNAKRRKNLEFLSHHLEALGFHTFLPPSHITRVYFEFLIRPKPSLKIEDRDLFIKALQAEGCDVSLPRYPLVHQQPLFTEGEYEKISRSKSFSNKTYGVNDLPITEQFNKELIKLPSFPQAEEPLLIQYVEAFTKVIRHWDKLSIK